MDRQEREAGQPAVATGADQRLVAHPGVGAPGLTRLRNGGPVAVVGLGTLGARLAGSLCAAGVPLLLTDRDRVEPVNVGLQPYTGDDVGRNKTDALARRLSATRPGLVVTCYTGDVRRIGPRRLAGCRMIAGALDSFRDRVWMAGVATGLGVPYLDLALDGTGRALYGRVSGYDPPRGGACYTCGWDDTTRDEVAREAGGSGCAALAAAAGGGPVSPPTLTLPGFAEVIAGVAAVQALRLLLGDERDRVIDRECRVNLTAGRWSEDTLRRDPRCRSSHTLWSTVLLDRSPDALTFVDLFELAERRLGGAISLSVVDDPLVLEAACPGCGRSRSVVSLRSSLPPCPACHARLIPLASRLRSEFGRTDLGYALGLTCDRLGIPPGGAVRASNPAGADLVLLFDTDGDPAMDRVADEQ